MNVRNLPPHQGPTLRKGPPPVAGPVVQTRQPGISQQEWHDQQARRREEIDLTKRRSHKPADREIPDGVEEMAVGDAVEKYNKLRDVERKLDSTMTKKRQEIAGGTAAESKRHGTMRIWISNTVENQPWQVTDMDHDAFDFSSNVEATFRVKVEGRIFEDDGQKHPDNASGQATNNEGPNHREQNDEDDDEPAAKRPRLTQSPTSRKKLSHFFKSMSIEFDRSPTLQPDNFSGILWERPSINFNNPTDLPSQSDFDCLEFTRKSDENINITVKLIRDEKPERYKLAPQLAELLDTEVADLTTVLMAIWQYVKAGGLQDETEGRRVRCDPRLHAVLAKDSFYFPYLPELVRPLMFDPDPIHLQYTIRVDKDFHNNNPTPTVYDIPVSLEDPLIAQMNAMRASIMHLPILQDVQRIDGQIALLMQHARQDKAKHGFFTSMSKDPASFINRWTSSQKRDLDVILGATSFGKEEMEGPEWRTGGESGMWGSAEAYEGVGTYFSRLEKTARAQAGG